MIIGKYLLEMSFVFGGRPGIETEHYELSHQLGTTQSLIDSYLDTLKL